MNTSSLPRVNTNSTTSNSNNISAIISETSNFAMERYIRQGELNSCMTHANMKADQCACELTGSKDMKACMQGYQDVRAKFQHLDSQPFEPLVWCVNHMSTESSDSDIRQSWITGCINGIRK